VTCGSSGCQAAREYSLIRPPRTGFRWIRSGRGRNGEEAVAFAVGDALGDALVRSGPAQRLRVSSRR
jgi:hypothetical protein